MDRRTAKQDKGTGFVRAAAERAAALISAVAVMLLMLCVSYLPEEGVMAVTAAIGPAAMGPAPSPTPKPTADPNVFIRLADVDSDVSPEVLVTLTRLTRGDRIKLKGTEPKILVYHTHDTEAYRMTPGNEYEPSGDYRTEDDRFNVYAVGEELCRILREEYGIIAVHAPEKHEKPLITSAYSRSLETMLEYKRRYPSIEMFIDLHRDGVPETGYETDYVTVDGLECARMMFVVGTGKSGKSSQYGPEPSTDAELAAPDFESNYTLAAELTESLLGINERFMRNIRVKAGKYNQQVSGKCLLIEVGHNANTLEQAKNSMKYLARAIAELEK
ncbi:MAG: stage II sporulation protein P [Clostridia bacterium]|nr:stage II sporulation protein P [Clostridia bacterium]MBQ4447747.1 stage II sporulation protein P [Clostridia bacterium]